MKFFLKMAHGETLGRLALVMYFATQLLQGTLALFATKRVLAFGLINTIVVGYALIPLVLLVTVLSVVVGQGHLYARLKWEALLFFASGILSYVYVTTLALPHLQYVSGVAPPGDTVENSLRTAHFSAAVAGIFMSMQAFGFIYTWAFGTYVTRPWSVVHEFDSGKKN